jgi:hypothetical protein
MSKHVTIEKKRLQKLLDNFYEVCSFCDELDIYEHEELDEDMQKMEKWVKQKFGRKIDKDTYVKKVNNTNKQYTDLIGESYKNYLTMTEPTFTGKNISLPEYIYWIKTDEKYSEKWGLKIEERELSLEERSFIAGSNHNEVAQNIKMFVGVNEDHTLHKHLDDVNIPTKLITITYNNETIESYE